MNNYKITVASPMQEILYVGYIRSSKLGINKIADRLAARLEDYFNDYDLPYDEQFPKVFGLMDEYRLVVEDLRNSNIFTTRMFLLDTDETYVNTENIKKGLTSHLNKE